MCLERDFIRQVHALVLDLHDAGVNVTSVRFNDLGDKGTAPPDEEPPPRNRPPVWYHGGQGYSLDGDPIALTEEEHKVLKAFAANPTAMTKPELAEAADVENVPRVLADLTKRYNGVFGPAIRRPGRKGQGGYFIRVLPIAART